MNRISITNAERIKRLLLGSLRYRFSLLLITSGVLLVGGGTLREYIFLAFAEILGLEKVYQNWDSADTFSQVIGVILIAIGIIYFLYPIYADWVLNRKTMKSQIIFLWSKGEELSEEHINWLQKNGKWSESFWDLTKKTELSRRERIKLMKKI